MADLKDANTGNQDDTSMQDRYPNDTDQSYSGKKYRRKKRHANILMAQVKDSLRTILGGADIASLDVDFESEFLRRKRKEIQIVD